MADAPVTALFYSNPQPLSPSLNGSWRLKNGSLAFTTGAVCIPLVIGEFAQAARNYPVLFAAGQDTGPLVLTGLKTTNLFVENDQWDPTAYVPAYVRRYPFGLMALNDDAVNLALCLDKGCGWLVEDGSEGRALFENGEPTQLTKDALEFCSRFGDETRRTREFIEALRARQLLVDRQVEGTLADGKPFRVDGFQIIDEQKLTELDAETLVEWHRKGWLASAYFHLASLERVGELVNRQSRLPQAA
jgi:hypothetical protein